MTGDKAQQEGYKECQHTEFKAVTPIMLHTAHVQLQSCQKHDVIDTHLSKQFKGTVAVQNVQTKFPNQHASQNKTYDMWNTKPTQQQRSKKNDAKHNTENPRRISNKCCRSIGYKQHLHHLSVLFSLYDDAKISFFYRNTALYVR